MGNSFLGDIIERAQEARKEMMNSPDLWQIWIGTAGIDNAGTDANRFFQLVYQGRGKPMTGMPPFYTDSCLGPMHSFCAPSENSNVGNDYFVEAIPEGYEIRSIRIFQDDTGKKPGWALSSVRFKTVPPNDPNKMWVAMILDEPFWIARDEPETHYWKDAGDKPIGFYGEIFLKVGGEIRATEYFGTAVDIPMP